MKPTSSCGTRMTPDSDRPHRLHRHFALDRLGARSLRRPADQSRASDAGQRCHPRRASRVPRSRHRVVGRISAHDRPLLMTPTTVRARRGTILVLCAVFLASGLLMAALGPSLPDLAARTSSDLSELGRIFVAIFGGALAAQILGGHTSDRFGRRIVLVIAGVCCMGSARSASPRAHVSGSRWRPRWCSASVTAAPRSRSTFSRRSSRPGAARPR